jgi:hypothetical protein
LGGSGAAEEEDWERPAPQFVTIDDFVGLVEDCVAWPRNRQPEWDRATQVRWIEFERDFWPTLSKEAKKGFGGKAAAADKASGLGDKAAAAAGSKKPKSGKASASGGGGLESASFGDEGALVALAVWTQIRSLLKGSVEAAWGFSAPGTPKPYLGADPRLLAAYHDKCADAAKAREVPPRPPGTPLSLLEYERLPHGRCPLSGKQRRAAFEYYEMYAAWLEVTDATAAATTASSLPPPFSPREEVSLAARA